jgi:hypothetical protein
MEVANVKSFRFDVGREVGGGQVVPHAAVNRRCQPYQPDQGVAALVPFLEAGADSAGIADRNRFRSAKSATLVKRCGRSDLNDADLVSTSNKSVGNVGALAVDPNKSQSRRLINVGPAQESAIG